MELDENARSSAAPPSEEEDLRKGPWTVEEDVLLMNYIAIHGEGRWNSLARFSGLKRTGKSCRLRWLNYLRPDVRRGNITPEEQLLILDLHSRWGNRWSKIAQHLPGRTDNEIKNYWRTKVQKHAKQLQCDVNSNTFKDVMRYLWVPRLMERIRAASMHQNVTAPPACEQPVSGLVGEVAQEKTSPEKLMNSAVGSSSSSESFEMQPSSTPDAACFATSMQGGDDMSGDWFQESHWGTWWPDSLPTPGGYDDGLGLVDFDQSGWGESLSSMDDMWLMKQQI